MHVNWSLVRIGLFIWTLISCFNFGRTSIEFNGTGTAWVMLIFSWRCSAGLRSHRARSCRPFAPQAQPKANPARLSNIFACGPEWGPYRIIPDARRRPRGAPRTNRVKTKPRRGGAEVRNGMKKAGSLQPTCPQFQD